MVLEQEIIIEGIPYSVVISDEAETLLAAKAAGRVIVGMAGKKRESASFYGAVSGGES